MRTAETEQEGYITFGAKSRIQIRYYNVFVRRTGGDEHLHQLVGDKFDLSACSAKSDNGTCCVAVEAALKGNSFTIAPYGLVYFPYNRLLRPRRRENQRREH